ncbi:hypothetical protein NUW58_g5917 [Xylaria curta]|uniref:Uncharacterized protein n=1 Tax=Xylaria curta TaxID=42375 RepID=A0ACC1NZA6_9PEZI|nr:hypothetical protein NUW58_g5917 [Xylaria curta]
MPMPQDHGGIGDRLMQVSLQTTVLLKPRFSLLAQGVTSNGGPPSSSLLLTAPRETALQRRDVFGEDDATNITYLVNVQLARHALSTVERCNPAGTTGTQRWDPGRVLAASRPREGEVLEYESDQGLHVASHTSSNLEPTGTRTVRAAVLSRSFVARHHSLTTKQVPYNKYLQ